MARFVDNQFASDVKATIGVDFFLKNLDLYLGAGSNSSRRITLQMWDVSGESRFRSILPCYIAGTEGVMLVFDLTEPESLNNLAGWLEIISVFLKNNAALVLVGAKSDLVSVVEEQSIAAFMKEKEIKYFYRTSSMTGTNVDQAFRALVDLIFTTKVAKAPNRSDFSPYNGANLPQDLSRIK